MIFNRIQRQPPQPETNTVTGVVTQPPDNLVHDTGTLRLINSGSTPLNITGMTVVGPWQVTSAMTGTIAPGGHMDVTVKFIAQTEPKHAYNQTNDTFNPNLGGVWNGSLIVATSDPSEPTYTEQLAGWWQRDSEDSEEPNLQTIVNLICNYQTVINPTPMSNLTEANNKRVTYGDEVLSYYWQAANAGQSVGVYDLGSWHQQGNPSTVQWVHNGAGGPCSQRIQPRVRSFYRRNAEVAGQPGVWATGTFAPGSATFNFKIDYESSIDSANFPGGGGHHIRFFPVLDHTGGVVPNTYFMAWTTTPASMPPLRTSISKTSSASLPTWCLQAIEEPLGSVPSRAVRLPRCSGSDTRCSGGRWPRGRA